MWGDEGSVDSHIHLLLPLLLLLFLLLLQSVSSLHCRPHCWWSGNCQGLCIEMSLVEREHTVFQFVRLTHKLPLRTWRAPLEHQPILCTQKVRKLFNNTSCSYLDSEVEWCCPLFNNKTTTTTTVSAAVTMNTTATATIPPMMAVVLSQSELLATLSA